MIGKLSLDLARERYLRISSLQILFLAAALALTSVMGWIGSVWADSAVAMAAPALLVRLFMGRKEAIGRWAFLISFGLVCLAVPWTGQGIYHPVLFLILAWIQAAAFLVNNRVAMVIVAISLVDILMLGVGGARGWIHPEPAPTITMLMCVTLTVVHVAFFVGSPLAVIRRLLTIAATDLVARRRNEQRLEDLTKELERAVEDRRSDLVSARERLSEAVDVVAHRFQEPIARLQETTKSLVANLPNSGEEAWMADRISASAERMQRIYASFLRFCRLGAGSLQVELVEGKDHERMILEVWSEIRQGHPDRSFTFLLDPLPACHADPDLLRQVWQNLLSNAAKYTVGRDLGWIRAGHDKRGFFVEDNGKGFDMEWADQLFGVFSRLHADQSIPGDGIGLAMVRRIVERHGGQVSAESKEGHGATFHFRIEPVAPTA